MIYGLIYFQQYDHRYFVSVIERSQFFFLAPFLLWIQRESSHSLYSELRPEDLTREKLGKHADLRVEHGLHSFLAWRRVTLEKK